MAARRVGAICRKLHPILNEGECHVSVNSSGELDHPIESGGQASAVREALIRVLTRVPENDEEEDTPFGIVRHHAGIPIWRTLFRKEPYMFAGEFLEPYTLWSQWEIRVREGRFRGLDEDTGKQLMYVAWKEYRPLPVLRAEVVPEMGNKARHVTLSEYWLNVIQAPLSHTLVSAMKYHPSVFSSFHRQDQAWEAVKGLCRSERPYLAPGEAVLSSDLKDATNAQQWELTKSILKGFIQGYKLSFRSSYVDLVLGTIGPRLVLLPDNTSVLTTVGIMMGEAIAKPSLTLLNLSIEEAAFITYTSGLQGLSSEGPAPHRDWRYLHIGGDDHLAKGPTDYLELISEYHRRAGSHIDPGKHGYSRICVKYTERLINLRNLEYKAPFDALDHNKSIIVDSVKVRLLERGQSTMLKKDNKNVAIGKSTQLGQCLEWLPKDDRFYTMDKKASIRALFIERMGELLPRKVSNPRAFAAIHLPTNVGGYGLGLKEELQEFLYQSPEPTIGLIHKAYLGLEVRSLLKIFRKLNTNISTRGSVLSNEFEEMILENLNENPALSNAITWKEFVSKFPSKDDNPRWSIDKGAEVGILSFEEFSKRAARGSLFQELIVGGGKLSNFSTRRFVETYKYVWEQVFDDLSPYLDIGRKLNNSEISRSIKNIQPQYYLDINQIVLDDTDFFMYEEDLGYDFVEKKYIDVFNQKLPHLGIPPEILGIRCKLQ